MNGAVFLDRDNTIIHNDGDLGDPAQVRLIQGAASAIASLKGLNYRIIVVTNQGGVARGKFSEADVDRVNERINELIRANSGVFIDRFYYCPYHPEGTVDRYRRDHPWRKPRPGMLLQAARDLGLDLRQSWMIGDQMRDVQAGFSAGVVPILLSHDGAPPPPTKALPAGVNVSPEDRGAAGKMVAIEPVRDFFVVRSLIEAVRLVGQKSRPTNVTAAMKTERIEVVTKPQPRVAIASYEHSTLTAQEELETIEQSMVVVNEAATEAAALQVESPSIAKRKTRGDAGKPGEDAARPINEDVAKSEAKTPTTETPRAVESRSREVAPTQQIKPDATADLTAKGPSPTTGSQPSAPPAAADQPSGDTKPPRTSSRRRQSVATAAPGVEASTGTAVHADASVAAPESAALAPVATDPPISLPLSGAQPSTDIDQNNIHASAGLSSSPTSADQTLRQILQELRSQRKVGGEFTYAGVMAIVLQMVAGVCLLAALLMGSGDDGLFLRWIGCAVVLQLATLAMLLFRKT